MYSWGKAFRISSAHASSGRGAAALGERVGNVDLHANERAAERLTEVVGAQRSRAAAAERALHHEVECAHVGRFVAVDPAEHHRAEVRLHPFGGDLAHDARVGVVVVGEDRDVGDVALVAGAVPADLAKREPRHHRTSSIVTRTSLSTRSLSMSVGQMPSSSVAPPRPPPPAPVSPAGGADSVSGINSRPDHARAALVVASPRDPQHALGRLVQR